MDINLCPNASPCIGPPHQSEWWAAFTLRDGTPVGMRVKNMMGLIDDVSVAIGATPPPSAEPVFGSFWLVCGTITDAICTGAAGGSTDQSPNKPPSVVRVEALESTSHYSVTLTFEDNTSATVEVAPNDGSYVGWSSVTPSP